MGLFGLFGGRKESLITSGLLSGARDCHTHILPDVDDGVRTMEQAQEILAYEESAGISEVWCTPHVMEDVPNATDQLLDRFSELRAAYKGPVQLHLAAEYMLDTEFEKRLDEKDLLTMWDDLVLVETSANIPPYNLLDIFRNMLSYGYRPLLAHPERYRYMQMKDYADLHDMGVFFQVNLGSLVSYYGETARKKAEVLLEKGWYSAAGSDCHRLVAVRKQFEDEVLTSKVRNDLDKLLRL